MVPIKPTLPNPIAAALKYETIRPRTVALASSFVKAKQKEVRLSDWRELQLRSFVQHTTLYAVDLQLAYQNDRVGPVAQAMRNLMEIYTWTQYTRRSEENAKRFYQDAARDVRDTMEVLQKFYTEQNNVGGSTSVIDIKLARYFASFLLTETTVNLSEDLKPGEHLNPALKASPEDLTKRSVRALAEVVNDVNKLNRDAQSLQKGRTTAASFILSTLRELRELICGNGKTPKKLSDPTKSILAGLTVFLAHKFSLSDGTSTAFAAMVLITITQATKNAFCMMDDVEVYKAIKKPKSDNSVAQDEESELFAERGTRRDVYGVSRTTEEFV